MKSPFLLILKSLIVAPFLVICSTLCASELCLQPAMAYNSGSQPTKVVAADLNDDNYPDLAVVHPFVDSLILLFNLKGQSLLAPVAIPVGDYPIGVCIADVDADGDNDVVVVCDIGINNVWYFPNIGSGNFGAPQVLSIDGWPSSVTAVDMDRDNILDLVIACEDGQNVSILFGGGSGGFVVPAESYPAGEGPWDHITADLNGDGWLDVAVANIDADSVGVLINDGSGALLPLKSYPAGNSPVEIACADLDLDGDIDLAVTDVLSDKVAVLINDGTGAFASPIEYDAGDDPDGIAIADLDMDGFPDLLATNSSQNQIALLTNLGGTFAAPILIEVGQNPGSISALDFDDDNRPDLATANFQGNSVSVLLNCFEHYSYTCEGVFRQGHECAKACDGNWSTSAVPDAYGDSIYVYENYVVPTHVTGAIWRFRVLRNNPDIVVRASVWNDSLSSWQPVFDSPESLNYETYSVKLPSIAIESSILRTRMMIKNSSVPPLQSGEYLEGVVDWIYDNPASQCEGTFRPGDGCDVATDADWTTGATADAYGDSVDIIEEYHLTSIQGSDSCTALWHFRALRNNPDIRIHNYYWSYIENSWKLLFKVPENDNPSEYTVQIPSAGISISGVKTRVRVKNADFPFAQQSGYYYDGAIDIGDPIESCGDADYNGLTYISDAVFLINYIFAGGSEPSLVTAGDADCNDIVTISDAVYLINYIFAGGPAPCANCGFSASKLSDSKADLSTSLTRRGSKNDITVNLESSAAVRAVQLDFTVTGEVRNVQVTSDVNQLQLFSGEAESGYRLGLIDMTGTAAIPAGSNQVVVVSFEGSGELNISSATVVDNDASEMPVTITATKRESSLPVQYDLAQNQPNPFNPSTDISFSLPKADRVKLVVYNILGAEIAVLVDEVKQAGIHRVTWDGKDKSGKAVASGVYLYKLFASEFSQSRKMLLLK